MIPAQARPLTQDDLLRIDRFIHSDACGREAMSLSRAHGFLTAVASGPEDLEPAEWIRLVFDEPVFADGEQARELLGLAMRLYQDIGDSLQTKGRFRPVLEYVRNSNGRLQVDAAAWCRGFISGTSLCQEHWSYHSGGQISEPLKLIFHLAKARPGHNPGYDELCDALPTAVELLYLYWRVEAGQPD